MSSQSKFLTIGLILAFGIGNAYYSFNPSLKEVKERREAAAAAAAASKTTGPQQSSAVQSEPGQQDKSV